ncbi:hypothetical protein [Scytonema sp. NUACC26]|uniref:hypothetical protein n=1 Tax=Scytonema sp. NUACC26 TaxID=3140176 RepID=UPI0038B34C86
MRQNLATQTISEPEDRELMMRLAPLYQQERELAKQERRVERELSVITPGFIHTLWQLSVTSNQ